MMKPVNQMSAVQMSATEILDDAGFGALQTERGCLPLIALDIVVHVSGLAAQTMVRQTFRNALDEPLEATYIFPLPDRAAVTSFRMRVGDRIVDGELKERSEARADYVKAIQDGHRAGIAEEDRSGTFNLRVGNIPPKQDVAVELTLVGPLPVSAGEATLRFPLVVAPRYVPGIPLDGPSVGAGWACDTDQVPDASRVTPPVLLPGFPNPVRLSLSVELDPGAVDAGKQDWAKRVQSSLHSVISDDGPPWTIRLQPDERLNRDFILRMPVSENRVQASLMAMPPGDEPGTFALTLVPPIVPADSAPVPRDIVFVLDRSGSMQGWKMVAARRAVGRLIDTLLDDDRFTVLAFDEVIEQPHDRQLVQATNRNRWRALEWLGKMDSRGGTEMGPALQHAVRLLARLETDRERIIVLVTDGQVAGEDVVIRELWKSAAGSIPRIYTLGIDRAVNAGFLQRLADLGGGNCDLVETEERLDAAMEQIQRAIVAPALSQLQIEPIGAEVISQSVVPSRLPDLYADRPVTILGQYLGELSSLRLQVRALDSSGKPWEQEIAARPVSTSALRSLWGRAKIRELEDDYAAGNHADFKVLSKQIVDLSLTSHVLSRFTAYVAVDHAEVVNEGGRQHQIVQPVEQVDGWEMEVAGGSLASFQRPAKMCLSMRASCSDQKSVFRKNKIRRSIAPTVQRAGSQSERPEAQPPAVASLVAKLRSTLTSLSRAGLSSHRTQSRLKKLIHRLEQLETLVRESNAGAATTLESIRQAVVAARKLLATGNWDKKLSLEIDPFDELRELVIDVLAKCAESTIPATARERFWK